MAGRNDQVPTTHNERIGLDTTIKYLLGAAGIALGATIKYLQRSTSGAAGNGLCTTIKFFVNQDAGAGKKLGQGPMQGS
jgi:hypothetical protein